MFSPRVFGAQGEKKLPLAHISHGSSKTRSQLTTERKPDHAIGCLGLTLPHLTEIYPSTHVRNWDHALLVPDAARSVKSGPSRSLCRMRSYVASSALPEGEEKDTLFGFPDKWAHRNAQRLFLKAHNREPSLSGSVGHFECNVTLPQVWAQVEHGGLFILQFGLIRFESSNRLVSVLAGIQAGDMQSQVAAI